jgi:hypothetical protein
MRLHAVSLCATVTAALAYNNEGFCWLAPPKSPPLEAPGVASLRLLLGGCAPKREPDCGCWAGAKSPPLLWGCVAGWPAGALFPLCEVSTQPRWRSEGGIQQTAAARIDAQRVGPPEARHCVGAEDVRAGWRNVLVEGQRRDVCNGEWRQSWGREVVRS